MIDLTEFSDIVPKTGRHGTDCTYITVTDSRCHISLSKKDFEQVTKYLGHTVNVKRNSDLSILVLAKGADRRVGTVGRDISIVGLRESIKGRFGDAIRAVYYEGSWDEDERGSKVFVLRYSNRKEYAEDATIRKVR